MTKTSFWQRLKEGLKKSSSKLSDNIKNLFQGRAYSPELLSDLEEVLLMSDLGVKASTDLIETLKRHKFEEKPTEYDVRVFLATELAKRLESFSKEFMPPADFTPPYVYLFFGVNGAGKTTSIAKMAHQLKQKGLSCGIAACDTFRAAATEQLETWAKRIEAPFFDNKSDDAASVAFDALTKAKEESLQALFVDTAGRLPNKPQLLDELKKIIRVLQKVDSTAPHKKILVVDATTGQHLLTQVDVFHKAVGLDGIIMTKLDGTAKGGVLLQVVESFQIPILGIGVGETLDDLQPFIPTSFASSLLGLEETL